MPKGIKKPTEKSLREAIEKQERAIHDKELALTKAKEEYDAIPEEEHQRRIAEQQEANRERYDRKMMRKGYK